MPRPGRSILFSLLLFLFPLSAFTAEEKDRLVRNTEARTAEEQRKGFKLPDGFSIQLFADESLLGGKPINMAFDARGRLWVSSTQEYPYAVPKNRWSDPQGTRAKDSKDTIRILEDSDGDGRADKVTVFADEMNIPTGVLPYKNGCVAYSIPNLWFFDDTDGDGKCDQRKILFGPLGWEKDTHGMVSSLRLGLDGWVYATHGFSNTSHFEVRPENNKHTTEATENTEDGRKKLPSVVKPDGLTLDITSGSVFRFQPDGSRVEPWTTGQVNPFGLCWDSWGNLYSADCHSNPITQLIRGAIYPSFGKPHDGLGFAPVMCSHAHGSTGLCGIIYLDGGVWGPEWDDHMFVGNCVTSRVNHDRITFTGSTPKANEAPDFLVCDDPWFRPVDLQLGPDSALYVADFYNRIIGHYEVPLDHPKRDRHRGRIWRVVRVGFTGKLTECDLRRKEAKELMAELKSPNLTRRYIATEELVSRVGQSALRLAREEITRQAEELPLNSGYETIIGDHSDGIQDVHALWAAFRLGDKALAFRIGRGLMVGGPILQGDDERLSVAAINVIAEKPRFDDGDEETVCESQFDGRGVRSMRAGGLCVARHAAEIELFGCLLNPFVWDTASETKRAIFETGDDSLVHSWKLAMRAVLSQPGRFDFLRNVEGSSILEKVADVAATVPSTEAASWLLDRLDKSKDATRDLPVKLSHIARYLPSGRTAELVTFAQKHFAADLDTQLDLFAAIREGRKTQKERLSQPLATWSAELTQRLLDALQSQSASTWHPVTPPTDANPNPWQPKSRKCADGKERLFLDSHVAPGSEKHTGTLRSVSFPLPSKLSFWLAGHRGVPTTKPHDKTFVRLVSTETGEELARAYPPRNDAAQQIIWTFSGAEVGTPRAEQVFLEVCDNDSATAYAWLAAGGFEPAVVTIPGDSQKRDQRIRLLAQLSGTGSLPVTGTNGGEKRASATLFLTSLPDKTAFTPDTRVALAEFLADRKEAPALTPLTPLVRDAELAPVIFAILQNPETASEAFANAFRTLPFRPQAKLAANLAGSAASAERLLNLAPPVVLAEPLVSAKLKALKNDSITQRLQTLTASLPPQNEALNKLIAQRLKSFNAAKADVKRGEEIYTTVCFTCHRIGVRGNLVGPQLDGIGARGAERLLEDILDPNRAVDPAFRLHLVKRNDGSLYAGLLRREEGDAFIFADATAQESRIAKSEITSNEESPLSLMPPGLGEALNEQQLHDLLAYLLARK